MIWRIDRIGGDLLCLPLMIIRGYKDIVYPLFPYRYVLSVFRVGLITPTALIRSVSIQKSCRLPFLLIHSFISAINVISFCFFFQVCIYLDKSNTNVFLGLGLCIYFAIILGTCCLQEVVSPTCVGEDCDIKILYVYNTNGCQIYIV